MIAVGMGQNLQGSPLPMHRADLVTTLQGFEGILHVPSRQHALQVPVR